MMLRLITSSQSRVVETSALKTLNWFQKSQSSKHTLSQDEFILLCKQVADNQRATPRTSTNQCFASRFTKFINTPKDCFMTTTALQIEMWTLDRVRPYENNPRNNDRRLTLSRLRSRSTVSRSQSLSIAIAHHRRPHALEGRAEARVERVPVVVASHLTPEQVRAYRIAETRQLRSLNGTTICCRSNCRHCRKPTTISDFLVSTLRNSRSDGHGVNEGLTDPDEIPEPPDEQSLNQAIFGSSVTIGCSVVIPHRQQTWIVCWTALPSI